MRAICIHVGFLSFAAWAGATHLAAKDNDLPVLSPESGGKSIDERELREGDIIVTTGEGKFAEAIRDATDGLVSHAAIFVGDDEIVDAAPGVGVNVRPLSDIVEDATLVAAFRRTSLERDRARTLVANARAAAGGDSGYNYWGIVRQLTCIYADELCEVTVPGKRFFCSELIFRLFESAGAPLTEDPPKYDNPGEVIAKDAFGRSRLLYLGHLKYTASYRE